MAKEELEIFRAGRDLCDYALTILARAPKVFRPTITNRIINEAMNIKAELIIANNEWDFTKRLAMLTGINTKLKVISSDVQTGIKIKLITNAQNAQFAMKIRAIQKLLFGWIRSIKERKEENAEKADKDENN
jgi:hypothetical protein